MIDPARPTAGSRCASCLERRGYVEQAEVWQARAEKAEARVVEIEGVLRRLWSAVAAYGCIGFEGSELLEVMSEARKALPAGSDGHA